jgi:ribonuclease BN (tRNA processing enzyme)
VLIDCGNGCTANLQKLTTFNELDAIIVTHRHIDHCGDMVGMAYDLAFGPRGATSLPVYAAPEVMDLITNLIGGESQMDPSTVYKHMLIDAGESFDVGPMHFELFPSIHPVPTVSMRITVGNTVIAYSSDSAGGDALLECAREADLFLCEATWQGHPDEWPAGFHLTSGEAGAIGTEAKVDKLVLTHILGAHDPAVSLTEARETFDGDLEIALDLDSWNLPT